jgi:hypothetical protein
VGFGHGLRSNEQECAACDKRSSLECTSSTRDLDCDDLFNCHRAVDCVTGEPLGLPVFAENQCSYTPTSTNNDLTTNDNANNDDRNQGGGFSAASQQVESPDESGYDKDTLITGLGGGLGVVALIVATVFIRRKVRAKWGTGSKSGIAANNNNNSKHGGAAAADGEEGTVLSDHPSEGDSSVPFRSYRGASILETGGDDDVEAIHMTGRSKLY